jgi:hypothetical protein
MKTKKELKAYLRDHVGEELELVMYSGDYGEPIKKEKRTILEARSKDLITGRRDLDSGELVPVYLDYKSIDTVTSDFFQLTSLLGNVIRFYY